MIEVQISYSVYVTLLLSHITADGKFYPETEYQIKRHRQTNHLFDCLFQLQIEPGEAFRFIKRCYPETIVFVLHSNQNIVA